MSLGWWRFGGVSFPSPLEKDTDEPPISVEDTVLYVALFCFWNKRENYHFSDIGHSLWCFFNDIPAPYSVFRHY